VPVRRLFPNPIKFSLGARAVGKGPVKEFDVSHNLLRFLRGARFCGILPVKELECACRDTSAVICDNVLAIGPVSELLDRRSFRKVVQEEKNCDGIEPRRPTFSKKSSNREREASCDGSTPPSDGLKDK